MYPSHNHPNDPTLRRQSSIAADSDNEIGIVYKKTGASYTVQINGRSLPSTLSARLYRPAKISAKPAAKRTKRAARPAKRTTVAGEETCSVVVGDLVRLVEMQPGAGTILAVMPRRNKIARRSAVPMPGAHPFEQVIAANMDQVVPVFAADNPPPKWNLLDRYLVSAEAAGIPALICISKLDLAPDDPQDEFWQVLEEYRRIDYPLVCASAVSGAGLEQLRQALQGRFSVLLGKSGVGKTTLLNALQPGLGLRVDAVSQVTGKGKHTTTHQEMFPLLPTAGYPETVQASGAIVDTPGVREFGLWEVNPNDLALFFPEMRPLVGRCRFGLDCQHDEEPGCAIRKAVMERQISPRRYQSYMRLKEEI